MCFAQTDTSLFQESVGLFNVMQKGGPLMWFILLASIIAVAVFIERFFYYQRCHLHVNEFLVGIVSLLRKQNYLEALERCEEGFGPVARVAQTAILRRHLAPSDLRDVVREVAQLQVPQLEANLPLLATVGYISPLLGLLGTVMGMIEAFLQVNKTGGAASVSDLAAGIWTALITTAGGLTVAIPCYVAYNYLVSRSNHIVNDMERTGIEVIHALTEPITKTEPSHPTPAHDPSPVASAKAPPTPQKAEEKKATEQTAKA